MHPRNPHTGRYDFDELEKLSPGLRQFARPNPRGDRTIDFTDPFAVVALNRALLKKYYGIENWEVAKGFLCPPIPGRADHIHTVADLLAETRGGKIPRGLTTKVLDIGVGATCIYPIIGYGEYDWSFVGSDVNPEALEACQKIIEGNSELKAAVELRLQPSSEQIFRGVIRAGEKFDLTICNPPFHASEEEAQASSRRKWENLGQKKAAREQKLNFGGQAGELSYPGGELAFIREMIQESTEFVEQVGIFSTLVSKDSNLDGIYRSLKSARVSDATTLEMEQGQKKSRIVAWTFR